MTVAIPASMLQVKEISVSSPSTTVPAFIRAGWEGRAIKLLARSMTS
ncbi:BQ5605_C006g04340 [Microbotryum silenes-dioicae]|uniref:BQ5605_C006g04340 protein n=1 Tax=Microbotryum silenes-dioicae TaxID=796604 RepID=A0A2X0N0X0_9BASI|nr:BQ5605_C006g04340 [Microbotryum silenes-dioicae]